MQHIAANARQWLQPNTVFLGDESTKNSPHESASSVPHIDLPLELDLAIPDTPALETGLKTQAPTLQLTQESASQALDFNLDGPVELDHTLPADHDFAPTSDLEDSSLDLEISDADFLPTANMNNSLDFHLDELTQNAHDTHIDLRLDDLNRPA